jgi:integrase
MARKAKELGPLEVLRLTKPGYHNVGGVAGLILQITKAGKKSWLLKVLVAGRRRELGLGGYPDVTLAGAKEAAREIRQKIAAGIDPTAEKLARKNALAEAVASALTFKEAAENYILAKESGWKNKKHAAQWRATLEAYAYPIIGHLQVAAIETQHVVNVLQPIWNTKTETASRLRGRMEVILDAAKVSGKRNKDSENPARWRGHLSHLFATRSSVQKPKHFPALGYKEVSQFLSALRDSHGMSARALEFSILTAARSGEVRCATWSEIDLNECVWIIPAARMKAEREHHVPLSKAAVTLLKSLPKDKGTSLLFPNEKGAPLSDMTLTATIRRMDTARRNQGAVGWRDKDGAIVTAHGFRSTFRDWAGDTTNFPDIVCENALAHQLPDKTKAAYLRGTTFQKRRRLMESWANYCNSKSKLASVTPINAIKEAA